MAACGLDFGTSNTTLGLAAGPRPALVPLEGANLTIPSAIFFEPGRQALVGRAAMAAYVEGTPGRLMRSLKSVLGSSLLEETTPVGRERIRFRDVIARYLAVVKARAEAAADTSLDTVVHGRPVHFVDGDPEGDARAEDALREIARSIGFAEVSFQFEPIAAALDYEQQVRAEEIALIADIGGGTSEVAVISLNGIVYSQSVRIGGDRFDDAIINYVRRNHGTLIGETTAERIKLEIGCAFPQAVVKEMEVSGRNLAEGVPRMIVINSNEVLEALHEPLSGIVSAVKQALEQTPPELCADVAERGIVLTGGGALLRDLDKLISEETGLHVHVADDPLTCVARGGGRALELIDMHGNEFFSPE